MSELLLLKPSKELKGLIWDYRQEYFDFGEASIDGSYGLARYKDFDQWLEDVLSVEKNQLSKRNVHESTFFSIRQSDNKIIGSIQIRHSLTPKLERHGGHIGYAIRPSERGKGYGKKQLSLGLDIAERLGVRKVVITCNADNIASSKTIISCGGRLVFENVYDGTPQQIFEIAL